MQNLLKRSFELVNPNIGILLSLWTIIYLFSYYTGFVSSLYLYLPIFCVFLAYQTTLKNILINIIYASVYIYFLFLYLAIGDNLLPISESLNTRLNEFLVQIIPLFVLFLVLNFYLNSKNNKQSNSTQLMASINKGSSKLLDLFRTTILFIIAISIRLIKFLNTAALKKFKKYNEVYYKAIGKLKTQTKSNYFLLLTSLGITLLKIIAYVSEVAIKLLSLAFRNFFVLSTIVLIIYFWGGDYMSIPEPSDITNSLTNTVSQFNYVINSVILYVFMLILAVKYNNDKKTFRVLKYFLICFVVLTIELKYGGFIALFKNFTILYFRFISEFIYLGFLFFILNLVVSKNNLYIFKVNKIIDLNQGVNLKFSFKNLTKLLLPFLFTVIGGFFLFSINSVNLTYTLGNFIAIETQSRKTAKEAIDLYIHFRSNSEYRYAFSMIDKTELPKDFSYTNLLTIYSSYDNLGLVTNVNIEQKYSSAKSAEFVIEYQRMDGTETEVLELEKLKGKWKITNDEIEGEKIL